MQPLITWVFIYTQYTLTDKFQEKRERGREGGREVYSQKNPYTWRQNLSVATSLCWSHREEVLCQERLTDQPTGRGYTIKYLSLYALHVPHACIHVCTCILHVAWSMAGGPLKSKRILDYHHTAAIIFPLWGSRETSVVIGNSYKAEGGVLFISHTHTHTKTHAHWIW